MPGRKSRSRAKKRVASPAAKAAETPASDPAHAKQAERQATQQVRTRIKQAAVMRAAGRAWAAVAKAMRVSCSRARQWPGEYPRLWAEMYSTAETHVLEEAAAEATEYQLWCMRRGRRSKAGQEDRKLGQSAAHSVLNHRARMKGQSLTLQGSGQGGTIPVKLSVAGLFEDALKGAEQRAQPEAGEPDAE